MTRSQAGVILGPLFLKQIYYVTLKNLKQPVREESKLVC